MNKNILALVFCLSLLYAKAQSAFITTWKTDNIGISANNQITIPTFDGSTYNYAVDWGDGTSNANITGDVTHTYSAVGTYTVSITGTFPRIYFNRSGFTTVGDEEKILTVEQWGTTAWTSMEEAFSGCRNLRVRATDTPNLANVTSLKNMFVSCSFLWGFPGVNNPDSFNSWNVSMITDMSGMFDQSGFNQNISSWNVGNVTDMSAMFRSSSFNQNINNWNVSKVTDMSNMFGSSLFNQELSGWNVGSVQDISFMFYATHFDRDLSGWDVGNVTNMNSTFRESNVDVDLGSWDVSKVTDMLYMFDDSDLSNDNYDNILLGWSQLPGLRSNVLLGANDAQYCLGANARQSLIDNFQWSFSDLGINCVAPLPFVTTWKTDNPGISADDQITIPTNSTKEYYDYAVDWGDGTSNTGVNGDITHTYSAPGTYTVSISGRFPGIYFNDFVGLHDNNQFLGDADKIISIDQWGNNRWIDLRFAFAGCDYVDMKATDIPDLSRGPVMTGMFVGCYALVGNDTMNAWDMQYVSSASHMFQEATKFNGSLNNWDTRNLRYMDNMFKGATEFDQNLGNWDLGSVTNIDSMFDDSGLSNKNYDLILLAWAQQPALKSSVEFGANNTQFCDGEVARKYMIDTFDWIFNDAGKNPNCNVDNDADGVLDHLDDCLNTPLGNPVYESGCSVLSSNSFLVQSIGETCPDKNNAQIIITSVFPYDYTATINGQVYEFMDSLTVDNLVPGNYNVCIALASESFAQCYDLEIIGAADLIGDFSAVNGKLSVSIDQGTAPYIVSVNGKAVLRTFSKTFSLDAAEGDRIAVMTDKICEGSLTTRMQSIEAIKAFPNPTTESIEITLPATVQQDVVIDIITMNSTMVSSASYPVEGRIVKLDLNELPSGMYMMKVHLPNPTTLKIVKL